MKKINIFMVLLLMCSGSVNAAIFSRILGYSTFSEVDYNYSIDVWTDDPTPNPCFGDDRCYISINHRHYSDGRGGDATEYWYSRDEPCIETAATMTDLRECLQGKVSNNGVPFNLPMTGIARHSGGSSRVEECVGLFWSSRKHDHGTLLPGSVCGLAPPPVGACSLPSSINLDHGNLSESAIQNSTATQSLLIDCNRELLGQLFIEGLSNGKLIMDDGSITSILSIEGDNIGESGKAVDLVTGQNTLEIKSTLQLTGKPTAGKHQGQAILILALQ